jgi:regulator of sigma E protease
VGVIIFIIVLGILILSHEFGHFIVAKKNNIRVDEFAIGFPPRLFKWKKGETVYAINAIPFGGYVKIHGEDDIGKPEDPRSFGSKSVLVRASVLIAGVFFNIVLAWFLISFGYVIGLPSSSSAAPAGTELKNVRIVVLEVAANSPAEASGIKAGDEILNFSKVQDFQNFIAVNKGKETPINLIHDGENVYVKLTPRENPPEGQGAIGIAMDEAGILQLPWYKAPFYGLKTVYELTIAIAVATYSFIINALRGSSVLSQVMGPIGIAGATGAAAKMGFSYLLGFVSLLSINLAIINIIPFPALDGGRILFLIIEKIKGSPISEKFSSIAHTVGLALLLILMLAITYRDILKLI